MPAFSFICGDDDFLIDKAGKEWYRDNVKDVADEFSQEVVDGRVDNAAGVELAVNRFAEAVQTISMFCERKVIWLKGVNFLADSVLGRSQMAKQQTEALVETLKHLDANFVSVLVTAFPVDRRRKSFKWFKDNGEVLDLKIGKNEEQLSRIVREHCEVNGLSINNASVNTLIDRTHGNIRLIYEELNKLACYLQGGDMQVSERLILEMVPPFGANEFFETAEAFFTLDLQWTLESLRRHFFTSNEARPLLVAMQNRNRLMIQLRVLMDAGELSLSKYGFKKSSFEQARGKFAEAFGGLSEKSSFHVFTQNLWYLGNKIAPTTQNLSLKKLINFQLAFTDAFEDLLKRADSPYDVMQDLAIRCLS